PIDAREIGRETAMRNGRTSKARESGHNQGQAEGRFHGIAPRSRTSGHSKRIYLDDFYRGEIRSSRRPEHLTSRLVPRVCDEGGHADRHIDALSAIRLKSLSWFHGRCEA